jgi:hypothetical protein
MLSVVGGVVFGALGFLLAPQVGTQPFMSQLYKTADQHSEGE